MAAEEHYLNVAKVYEKAWCYQDGGDFQLWVCSNIMESLPKFCKSIVDVGCGTGNFSKLLQDRAAVPVLGVEPSASMAAQAEGRGVEVVVADALSWAHSQGSNVWDAVMLKEVRHHVDDPAALYRQLAKVLSPNGRLIIVTRPDDSAGYPFPPKSHGAWREVNTIPLSCHIEALSHEGFAVKVEQKNFPVKMARADWESFLRNRTWSHLSSLTDAEIEEGIEALALNDFVEFQDQLILVIAEW
eukprot:CAMPEP_0170605390 /NCGR_PEP_ID=MMETSP0224-20130122/19949_1 /TAXON_ID=285029 /ORGANISM="Togula jolla, Strain CCCM 725" /LENGTH=242 /DNA_ID=CAMNT_0010930393 /DNA_START=79 /DNA_END=804 /DNA_ORIENTATION=-